MAEEKFQDIRIEIFTLTGKVQGTKILLEGTVYKTDLVLISHQNAEIIGQIVQELIGGELFIDPADDIQLIVNTVEFFIGECCSEVRTHYNREDF
jgi:hypothetical protein